MNALRGYIRLVPILFVAAIVAASTAGASTLSANRPNASTATTLPPPTGTVAKAQGPATPEKMPNFPAVISEIGSITLYPAWTRWGRGYGSIDPSVHILTQGANASAAISGVYAGSALVGATVEYIFPSMVPDLRRYVNVPTSVIGIDVLYNVPGVSTPLHLDAAVLSKIYQGKITSWHDPAIAGLNPGLKLPKTKIVTIHRSDSAASTYLFTSYLTSVKNPSWPNRSRPAYTVKWPRVAHARSYGTDDEIYRNCAQTVGCISYVVSAELAAAPSAGLGVASLRNPDHQYIAPSAFSVAIVANAEANATAGNGRVLLVDAKVRNGYPLTGYTYALVLHDQPDLNTAQTLRAFLEWVLSPTGGQSAQLLDPLEMAPLPPSVASAAAARVAQIH